MNDPDGRGDYLTTELFLPGALELKLETQRMSRDEMELFLIIDANEEILGRVFHFKTVPYFQSREIGYSIFSPNARGKGIMSEAVALLRDYLFETTLLNRLEIHMQPANVASEKVAIKCGFQYEGTAKGAAFSRGRFQDIKMYALLRQEWEQLKR